MVKTLRAFSILFLIVLGCATIPKESVVLNQEIGQNIQAMYESNTKLVNLYFIAKKGEVDKAAEKAVDVFYESIIKEINAGNAPLLTEAALRSIQAKVKSYYLRADSIKTDLEKSRILVLEQFNTHYMQTIRANEAITGLLQSHVDLDKATDEGVQSLKTMTGGAVDLTKVRDIVDSAILTSGDVSKKGVEIYPQIEKLLNTIPKK